MYIASYYVEFYFFEVFFDKWLTRIGGIDVTVTNGVFVDDLYLVRLRVALRM